MAGKSNVVKTHSGAKKRVKKLKGGKLKASHTRRRKFLAKKTANRKRRLRGSMYLHAADEKRILEVMPN